MKPTPTTPLSQLPAGARAIVARVVSASPEVDAVALRRLGELGFIPGEPVQLLRRGPGGREPLAIMVGETMFALRLIEAQCIEVRIGAANEAGSEANAERPATKSAAARPASVAATVDASAVLGAPSSR